MKAAARARTPHTLRVSAGPKARSSTLKRIGSSQRTGSRANALDHGANALRSRTNFVHLKSACCFALAGRHLRINQRLVIRLMVKAV